MRLPRIFRKNRAKRVPEQFSARAVHAPKIRFLRGIEVFVIVSVLAGTALLFLNYKKISLSELLERIPATLAPKQASRSAPKARTFEETVIAELKKLSIEPQSSQQTSEGNLLITTKEKMALYFDSKKDPVSQVKTLQTVLAKARIESKKIRRVDFRFENTVIEF